MKKIQYLMIALLCTVAQGAWAQGIYGPTDIYNESDLNWYISNGFRNLVLKADIALNNYVAIGDGKIVTIDLNGHDLGRGLSELTSYGNVIRVETGGTLTIKDSGTGGTITGGYDASGGAICIYGTVNFEGGTISGCKGSEGGAIYVVKDGTLNMKGGTITNCTASRNGGGAIYNKGTVTMSGGTIDGCSATDCGGIYNTSDGTLTISGGEIKNNSTTTYGGGGVVNYGAAYITGGMISGNHATTRGGGVWNGEDAPLTVTGGSIIGNTAGTNGGGLFSNSHITMRGNPIITGNTVGGSANNLYLYGSSQIICDGGAFTSGASIGVTLENYGRKFTNLYSFNNDDTAPATYFTMDKSGYAVALVDDEVYPGVLYVERSWTGSNTGGHVKSETKTCTSYSTISTTELTDDGWYVLSGENVFNDRIIISADVKFILADGSNAEFKKGIRSGNGSKLTIYAQEGGTGTLRATGSGDAANAAIGADKSTMGGSLIIHGGTIEASASKNNAAGIGGGDGESSGMQSITIYGGTVTATGKNSGAGIGGGQGNNNTPPVTIYGGTVTGNGGKYGAGIGGGEDRGNGTVRIYGGTVNATGGQDGAGIGGGEDGGTDSPVYIYGGTVNATGGEAAAGIGGGQDGDVNNPIYIYGGKVTAKGGEAGAGIGGGETGNNGTVTINGGTVNATGGQDAPGIGGGQGGDGGTVTINSGTVKATGGATGAGIGGYGSATVNINGGTVVAHGKYYNRGGGVGIGVKNGTLYFNMTGGDVTADLVDGGTVVSEPYETCGAGIGGGYGQNVELHITIDGGTLTATGAYGGAGIGTGAYNDNGGGGDIKSGSEITINGGTVNATGGYWAAGIGAGCGGNNKGTITINGGTITATGSQGGAGIGGGKEAGGAHYGGEGGTIIINGGKVTAIASEQEIGQSQAIGNGAKETTEGSLTIADNMCVKNDDGTTTYASGDRVARCRDYATRIVEICEHSGVNYTSSGESGHTFSSCTHCKTGGGTEAHTYGSDGHTCTKCDFVLIDYSTVTLYLANSDGTGYGDATTENVKKNSTYTLPECTSTPTDMLFVGWKEVTDAPSSIEADDSELSSLKAAGDEITVTDDVTYYARYQSTVWPGGGNGTVSDPYIISTEEHWNTLASSIENKKVDFSGKYIQLAANISVSQSVAPYSKNGQKFAGTFDGDGHTLTVALGSASDNTDYLAPFGSAKGATIKNLHVSGTVTSTHNAVGLVGATSGTNNITNCRVSVTVSANSDYTAGGIVCNNESGTLNIKGCIFDGTLSGSSNNNWGGFVGYTKNGAKTIITNCLFKPASVSVGTSNSQTFSRKGSSATVSISNSYYTLTCGGAQGTKAYTVESGTSGLTLDYSGGNNYGTITAYTFDQGDDTILGGLLYDGKLYTGASTKVTFTAETSNGQKPTLSTTSGTLAENSPSGDGGASWTLTMASADATVSATGYSNYAITLYNDPDDEANTSGKTNDETISDNRNHIADVTISGRTLIKDGKWNTLCLPFDMTATQVSAQLDPSALMELDVDGKYDSSGKLDNEDGTFQTGFDGGTLYLYFKDATAIEAGKPYIIKWTSGGSITPTFTGVTIDSHNPETIESIDGKVSFLGNYDPVTIGSSGDNTKLYLGADNNLYWPSAARTIKSFRAYFQLHGITAGEPTSGSNGIRAFSLHFGDDSEQTGITTTNYTNFTNSDNSWYSLDGRKLSGKPTAKGIYIYNGKKRVIK